MCAGRDQGETERLHAMQNGFSVIPHEVKGARGFAGRKPGKVRDVEIVEIIKIHVGRPIAAAVWLSWFIVQNWSLRRVADSCTTSRRDIEGQLVNCFVVHSIQYYWGGPPEGCCLHLQ